MRVLYAIFLTLVSLSLLAQGDEGDSEFVWVDTSTYRLQVACFRYSMELDASADEAILHLFADSRYRLYINGHFINFGPARFYPTHPMYDSYDILPYLEQGENVIAVKVMSNGTSTFQLRNSPPALVAWGSVRAGNTEMDLSTPGNWKCTRLEGYDSYAPRMTFALGPMEVYDERPDVDLRGWDRSGYDDSDWGVPVTVPYRDHWGTLSARNIPPLTTDIYQPLELTGRYSLGGDEEIYSFQKTAKDKSWNAFRQRFYFLGYTYIYSPVDRDVTAGIWWGDHFLNGEGPLSQEEDTTKVHRQSVELRLKAGWNFFSVKRQSHFGKWAFVMALPKEAGISLSPNKKQNDPVYFMVSGPYEDEPSSDQIKEESSVSAVKNWVAVDQGVFGNPAIEMAWKEIESGHSIPGYLREQVSIEEGDETALVYDFRYKKLGSVKITYDAPEGTIFDLGYAEDLKGQLTFAMKRVGLYMASRHVAAGGEGSFETFKPYGLRYLQINVRNNKGPVRIKKVEVINQIYPFEQVGSFSCSDPLLTSIWSLGWRTLEVCAEDSYTDTPFRERGLYAGDMLPQMAVTLAGSGDLRLVRRSLELFQDMYADLFYPDTEKHPDEIGLLEDYPLLTLEALRWYFMQTKDIGFLKKLMPNYHYLVKTALQRRNQDGLVHNRSVFIEWTQIEKRDVINTAYQAMLGRSCTIMAEMSQLLEDDNSHDYYMNAYSEIKEAVRSHCYDESRGIFYDGIKDGSPIEHYYSISSAWPMIAEMTSDEENQKILDHIESELQRPRGGSRRNMTTPYGSFYLLAVLYENGRSEIAEKFIRRFWAPMIYKHNDTAWENFDDYGIGTLSHAWSGSPTYYFTTQILGVDLGWLRGGNPDQLVFAPLTESVDWAKGIIPHEKGPISIAWKIIGKVLWVEIDSPEGIDWTYKPRGRLGDLDLWVNGEMR